MWTMVPGTTRVWQIGMGIAALAMLVIGMGAARMSLASELFALTSAASVVLAALPAFWGVIRAYGARLAVPLLLGLGIYALVVESIGVATGFPYGAFDYRGAMTGEIFSLVPWTVPFAWVPLVIASRTLTERFTRHEGWRWALALLLLVGLDLVLDPGAVAIGIWSYQAGGWYHGVPWTNFAGWVLTGGIALAFWPKRDAVLPLYVVLGPGLLLVFWAGVAVGKDMWLPAFVAVLLLGGMKAGLVRSKTLTKPSV